MSIVAVRSNGREAVGRPIHSRRHSRLPSPTPCFENVYASAGALTTGLNRASVTPMRRSRAATQLALWVGRKAKGSAHLKWMGGELVLYVSGLQIVGVEGDDNDLLAAAFGLTDGRDWFTEAQAAVASGQVSQPESNAVVKRALAERLRQFFLADDAEVTFGSDAPSGEPGLTISYPHLVVEMVLGNDGEGLVPVFLPEPELLLRCLPDFARRVAALGLTDEAVAILAKINNQRTAAEIADPSPHGHDVALRLLAAAVGAGLAEASAKLSDAPLVEAVPALAEAVPRRRWWPFLVAAVVVLAGAAALLYRPWEESRTAGTGGPWAVAVDGGCQPAELERLYRRQELDKVNLRVVPFGRGEDQCYRLVWGHFASKEQAESAKARLGADVVARGFVAHVVRVETGSP
jgi:hypothetical protein